MKSVKILCKCGKESQYVTEKEFDAIFKKRDLFLLQCGHQAKLGIPKTFDNGENIEIEVELYVGQQLDS